jgi:acyl-CoA thioesterase YciA
MPADPLPVLSDAVLPDGRELVMRVMPMPADANANGDIFGGWIMAQVDLAGAVLPSRIAKGRIATVAVNEFLFKQPVSVGDLLSFYARVERIGKTSITVDVEVYAERNPANLQVVKVTQARLTYVAIDAQGHPRQLSSA